MGKFGELTLFEYVATNDRQIHQPIGYYLLMLIKLVLVWLIMHDSSNSPNSSARQYSTRRHFYFTTLSYDVNIIFFLSTIFTFFVGLLHWACYLIPINGFHVMTSHNQILHTLIKIHIHYVTIQAKTSLVHTFNFATLDIHNFC